jgi:hypothetical protein
MPPILVVLTGLVFVPSPSRALDQLSLPQLVQEVAALQSLYELQITESQLKQIREMAKESAAKPGGKPRAKASRELRQSLVQLHQVLVAADNEERIVACLEKWEQIRAAEDGAELDDDYEVTEVAQEKAPELLRSLSAAQIATFTALYADFILDPREQLRDAFERVRGLADDEWQEYRDAIADSVARVLCGIDAEAAQAANDRIVQWLIVVRSLSGADFAKERDDLFKTIDDVVGKVGPTDVLRHYMEHFLSEMLSNPRLAHAINVRLRAKSR